MSSRLDVSDEADEWDRAARRVDNRHALIELATRFLVSREDQALGLAPASFLPVPVGRLWVLYWCAARRVDDSVERRERSPTSWRSAVAEPATGTLAERCVAALLAAPELTEIDLPRLLGDSLRGLQTESEFRTPQPWKRYLALLELKSVPTMHVFDALLAPHEQVDLREEHARAFAISAQLGDDCRDALHDLARGRCFVTVEEVGAERDLRRFVGSPDFAAGRVAACQRFLLNAQAAVKRFRSRDARTRAASLHRFWGEALSSGQVRPTHAHLRLPGPRQPPP